MDKLLSSESSSDIIFEHKLFSFTLYPSSQKVHIVFEIHLMQLFIMAQLTYILFISSL